MTGPGVRCHDLGLLEDRPSRSDGSALPARGGASAAPPQGPAATAAKAVACLALVLAVPLTGGAGRQPAGPPAGPGPAHRAAGPYTDPAGPAAGGDSGDPAGRAGSVELPLAVRAAALPYQGLGMLVAQRSGLRLGSGPVQERPSTRAGAGDATGDSQQWILRPVPGGELVVQALSSSGSHDPGALTVLVDGTVGLRADRSPAGQEEASQLWRFVDHSVAAFRADPVTGMLATAFRIRAHQGGCLLDGGTGRAPALGPCEDPRAWWTALGFYGGTRWGLR
ncbi:hypothetical protein GCM10010495_31870 [Kitasatospora herbaricolor]|uniref:hypothetical protein n=1 Tax=Kitasatospora herbaricolor TaxID=68217 RepID=UPI00174CCDFF|nr:hypothetical protein [Kitasatospora herbaricolor]MDQ0312370.1 hypothetical protein [Kitasatospora herbaricolor]GGV15331.1 hypothetical protein GCM10010495_31870 [Kitasatospora herbaricolor]